MSRAFVKESEEAGGDLPERKTSPYPNFVTPAGLRQLQERASALTAEKRRLAAGDLVDKEALAIHDRDLRYVEERLRQARLVDPAGQPRDRIAFGARIRTIDDHGETRHFRLVGEDEADPRSGKLSWVSPLGLAFKDARIGDSVTWRRPAGDLDLEILAIDYPAE